MNRVIRIVSVFLAMVMALFAGCKSVPSATSVKVIGYGVGVSAGIVVKETVRKQKTIDKVLEIAKEVSKTMPATNQTFSEVWVPASREIVAKYVEKGKIDADAGKLIVEGVNVFADAVDYIFTKKWPEARQYADLVCAAISGVTGGMELVLSDKDYKDEIPLASTARLDEDAYSWLKDKSKSRK